MLQANSFEIASDLEAEMEGLPATAAATLNRSVPDRIGAPGMTLSKTAIIGNFPPRQCGLATFTRDMYACLSRALPHASWSVIAMNDPGAAYDYPSEVTHQVPQNDIAAYRALADELNDNGTQVLFVQHEFGIYGGPSGAYLIECLERLNMPIVTTLHTVLENPNDEQRHVMKALIRLSSTLVTMAQKGRDILKRVYGVKDEQIQVVLHGAPSRPLRATSEFKPMLHLTGKKTLMTFGLLSPNKGIETVIKALPEIRKTCPEVVYLIIGATHPHLVRNEGEKYRESLIAMAAELGVEENVRFINRFMNDNDLIDVLQATDVYVTPYLTETQITSGTLSYALALGRPTVSTPYWHATEALADGVGIICPFSDVAAFAKAISSLLDNDHLRTEMSMRAYQAAQPSRWSEVARAYVTQAESDVANYDVPPEKLIVSLPEAPSWNAIARMTDDCGIFQHGKYSLPDRQHGYCADDNARALSLVARQSNLGPLTPEQMKLGYIYASFMNHAWNNDSRFRNFMSYNREWLDDGGSDDCCARSYECLIDVARSNLPADLRQWASDLAAQILPKTPTWNSLRSRAVMIKNLVRTFGVFGDGQEIQVMVRYLTRDLHDRLRTQVRAGHNWFEPSLSYDNARVCEGLIVGGAFLGEAEMVKDGLASLTWLMKKQTRNSVFAPIPNSKFSDDGPDHPLYDQQPLEVLATIDACLTALRISGDTKWRDEAMRAFAWFHGENTSGLSLLDGNGGCYDGLNPNGVNLNQGAESILSYPMSWAALKADL
ncbi:glycosyltransferase family 4 protein [Asticcacaulis sp. 201]|uniref:glycosyltransferase family 4 protein n=1 Tax=Asticcacaulis sp. 201 TaxID=3028787 RepID=UPI0029168225|nr:glycosyltransferase family 4 protein [Asticcacaulis sp. 201]MDV6332252.1 glycosyltransferase family 4 protein [Asticcacaulis sp. 201]